MTVDISGLSAEEKAKLATAAVQVEMGSYEHLSQAKKDIEEELKIMTKRSVFGFILKAPFDLASALLSGKSKDHQAIDKKYDMKKNTALLRKHGVLD